MTETEVDRSALRARLDDVCRLVGTDREAARIAGISVTQLHRYVIGSSEPRVAPVARLARAAEVRLGWLVWGEGQMLSDSRSVTHGLETLIVKDDAMMPELWPGRQVYFDPQARYDRPSLYVISTPDGIAVRAIMRSEGGAALVRCVNARYGEIPLAWDAFETVLKGRVVLLAAE